MGKLKSILLTCTCLMNIMFSPLICTKQDSTVEEHTFIRMLMLLARYWSY